MANKSKKQLGSNNPKWEKESAKIRSVQISLDFPDTADILLRTLAARQHKAPSSLIREILGMPSSPPKRARIGVSFNDDELQALGLRYDIDPNNRAEIRRKVTEEVTGVLSSTEQSSYTQGADGELRAEQGSADQGSELGDELAVASDAIYQRFQKALENRNSSDK